MPRQFATENRTYKGVEYLALLDIQAGRPATGTAKIVNVIPTDPCQERDKRRMLALWIGKSYNSWRDPMCQPTT